MFFAESIINIMNQTIEMSSSRERSNYIEIERGNLKNVLHKIAAQHVGFFHYQTFNFLQPVWTNKCTRTYIRQEWMI